MKIGISTASFFSKVTTEDTFALIDEMGIDICEVFLTTFREYRKEYVDELAKRKGKLEVYSVHSLNQHFEPELFNPVARTREDAEYFFREMAYAAKVLDANSYTFHGPARLKRTPYNINYKWMGERIDYLNGIMHEVTDGKAEIAYENVHWTYFSLPEFYAELKKHTNVKTCLDIKQAMQSKISTYDYVSVMGDSLTNVHLCDYDASGKLAVPGQGSFDFVELFKVLLDNGYDGPCMMELYAGNYNTFDEVRKGYEYLQDCLEKAKRR